MIYALGLKVYYSIINNRAGSFENMHGKVFDVAEYLKGQKDENTFFISMTNEDVTNTNVTSLAAIKDIKVVMNYYGYYSDSAFYNLFSKDAIIQPGKKVIIYLDQNKTIIDSINKQNKMRFEKTKKGQQLLVIQN
jgi:hypothetical protein